MVHIVIGESTSETGAEQARRGGHPHRKTNPPAKIEEEEETKPNLALTRANLRG